MKIYCIVLTILVVTIVTLSFEAEAQNDPVPGGIWPTTDWLIRCAPVNTEAGSEYSLAPEFDYQNCQWTHTESGARHEISEEEATRVLAQLKDYSERMSSMQFREPQVERLDQWFVYMYPGDCHCSDEDCCASRFRSDLQAVAEQNRLYVRSVGPEGSETLRHDMAHQLFHATKASYFPYTDAGESVQCQPFCWIGEGMAEAIASQAVGGDPSSDRKFDETLYTDNYEKARQTGLFWLTTGAVFGGNILPRVLEQNFSGSQGSAGMGVYQVHQALIAQGVEHGFLEAYGVFARHLTEDRYYTDVQQLQVDELETDFHLSFQDIEPVSVQAAKVRIDPQRLRQGVSENARVEVRIELEGENENLHLMVDGIGSYPDYTIKKDITDAFRSGEMLEFWVQLFNLNPDQPHLTQLQSSGRLRIFIDVQECTLMPRDVKEMIYIGKDKKGKGFIKMVYSLKTTEQGEGVSKGDFLVTGYSLRSDKTIGKGDLDFTCTEEGVMLQGKETGFVPNVGGVEGDMDMQIVQNTNIVPHNPQPGTTLEDAEVLMEAHAESQLTGAFGMNVHFRMTDRRVIGLESVTVPAGTYEAHRIEYNSNATVTFTGRAGIMGLLARKLEREASASNVIWLADGVGWVKQEITNRSGKQVFELQSVKR